jgi:hypothetical protein
LIGRWRSAAHRRLSEVQGLVAVLMKQRNGEPWTVEDRAFLRTRLRQIAAWTPALVLFLLPGSMLLLPLFAYLLDRRRNRRPPTAT